MRWVPVGLIRRAPRDTREVDMLYGDEKVRQMARSILPSTAYRCARWQKRRINQAARGRIRQALRRCLRDEAYADEAHLDWEPRRAHRDMVWTRREGDKLAPLYRWAEARTADVARPDRLAAMRALLPPTLIGRHALGHLAWRDHFRPEVLRWTYRRRARGPSRSRAERRRWLRWIIEDGEAHRALNRWMLAHHCTVTWTSADAPQVEVPQPPLRGRICAGLHDLDGFLDDLAAARDNRVMKPYRWWLRAAGRPLSRPFDDARPPSHHPEWTEAFDAFVDRLIVEVSRAR